MFTLPSRVDGFGMAVPEAMACGVPAIVSDMVGAKEVIEEGHNGFIVPSGNSDALVDRMRWCICNATLQFGNWNSVWKRFWRLSRTGVFEAFFDALAAITTRMIFELRARIIQHPIAGEGRRRRER